MEALVVGQTVTFVDADGNQYAATVLEAYGEGALVNVPTFQGGTNTTARRYPFEADKPNGPYITDAAGGTDGTFEGPIAEE